MREKKLSYNIRSSILLEIATIISGLVVPRMILHAYGSQVNGLVNSISQFLSIIMFLEFGVGAVVQSSLYKPLAEKNDVEVSKIICATGKYFGSIGKIFLVYITVLIIIYPAISNHNFLWSYSALLILAMSINTCAEYFFGIGDKVLLTANQRGYIVNVLQAILVLANMVFCSLLIYYGFGIHFIKLATSLVFILRVIIIRIYVNRHYNIDRRIAYEGEPIQQKWNGFAQHLAAVILESTDTIVLTAFSTLTNVSIYSAHYIVVKSIKQLIVSFNNGYMPLLGELWAKGDSTKLRETFRHLEWIINAIVVFVFGCTEVLLVPFVKVYTLGVCDAEYEQPVFAMIIVAAYMFYCLGLPYLIMVLAAGHYRQTQKYFMITAAINLITSILAVRSFGLVGVAIGTLLAMLFQLCWMVGYTKNNLTYRKTALTIRQFFVDAMILLIATALTHSIQISDLSYLAWVIMAIKVAVIWGIVVLGMNLLCYKNDTIQCIRKIAKRPQISE